MTARDQRIADDVGIPQALMCVAHGCPNRWTVDAGKGRLCSAHAWAEPHRWPEITQQQQWDETERARMNTEQLPFAPPLTHADKRAVMVQLAGLADRMRDNARDPKGWARRLQHRENAGEQLNDHQRKAWRAALGPAQAEYPEQGEPCY